MVFDRVGGIRRSPVESGGGSGGEVPAGGKAHDADASGIDLPFRGVRAGRAQSTLGIQKRHVRTSPWKAVTEDDAGNAVPVEPLGDPVPFRPHDQSAITSPGADYDGGSVRFGRRVDGYEGVSVLEFVPGSSNGCLTGCPEGEFRGRREAGTNGGEDDGEGGCLHGYDGRRADPHAAGKSLSSSGRGFLRKCLRGLGAAGGDEMGRGTLTF